MWTCLYFHALPLQVFLQNHEQPFAVSDSDKVFICNESARQSGIKPGMKLAAAFALDSRLQTQPRDPQKEVAALKSIALTAMQFTPVVSLVPPFAVLLEIGSSLSFFGGLDCLLEKIRGELSGHSFVLSSAPTASGAWLLARAGLQLQITEMDDLKAQLDDLRVELLDCPPDILQALKDIGMRTIGGVCALPRDGVARRFGQELLDMLDRAFGKLPDARTLFVPPESYSNKVELPAPISEAEALLFTVKRLIGELAGFLSAKGAGVLKLTLDLYHEDEGVTRVPLALISATRDVGHLTALLRERLFNLTLLQRVEAIALEAREVVPLNSCSLPLLADDAQGEEDHAQLIERLQARLGRDAVLALQPFPDHRPEFAWRFSSFILHPSSLNSGGRMEAEKGKIHPSSLIPHPSVGATRPLWLLDPPRPLKQGTIIEYSEHSPFPLPLPHQGRGDCTKSPLMLLSGPERIESGWWDGGDVARDYFVACDGEGAKFWLFWEEQWFLHGIFA